jgi:hypothetical protein
MQCTPSQMGNLRPEMSLQDKHVVTHKPRTIPAIRDLTPQRATDYSVNEMRIRLVAQRGFKVHITE